MNDSEKIESILWHEIGHLLIDILLVDKHPDLSIKELVIRNYECENVNWCGWVELVPKSNLEYKEVIKNTSLTAFKFLSLTSGCLFQAQNAPDKIDFKDCFAFKKVAIGKGDHDKFWELEYQLRSNYDVNEDDKKAFFESLNTIVFENYINESSKLNDFQKELKKVIDRESNIILADYKHKKTPENYSFKFEGDYLISLSKEITTLMSKNGFADVVKNKHLEIVTLIETHISKGINP